MTTAYSLSDTLPRDLGGAKFTAWINDQTSQLDFALPWGVGASTMNGKILAKLGVAVGGIYLENPGASTVPSGKTSTAGISEYNELFVTGAPLAPSMVTTSRNTVKTSSGIVFAIHVAGASVKAGDVVTLQNQNNALATYVFGKGRPALDVVNETGEFSVPNGGWRIGVGALTGASITIVRTLTTGTASVTVTYR